MGATLGICLLLLAFGVAGFLFARNVYFGLRTGTVLARDTRYHRTGQPILFWIALGFSALLALFSFSVPAIAAYLLVRSGA
jgi:hypothetical protein